ncbi:hypothetical protein E2C01_086650 [Portunus trituberculatus]|uniref:Uncharacterized protein n=1 Tax=Portunus trituberculatus TaxID=210409 RepID=A0A5B7JGY4_PORTR|nr:hypothetical protein [Portunus trituberculatus]
MQDFFFLTRVEGGDVFHPYPYCMINHLQTCTAIIPSNTMLCDYNTYCAYIQTRFPPAAQVEASLMKDIPTRLDLQYKQRPASALSCVTLV